MKTKILLQQDDCAPDAYLTFLGTFITLFGISFTNWRKEAKNVSKYDDEIVLERNKIYATCSASEQEWTIYEILEP